MKVLIWCRDHIRFLVCLLFCLLMAVVLTIAGNTLVGKQYSQQEAERWAANDIRYHQVSAFMQSDSQITKDMISEVRSTLQSKLTDASITEEAVSGRLWIDAYAAMHDSSIGKLTDIGSASVDSVQIIGVGGDFFQFHPLNMISGSIFSENDISKDRVVLDENTAWTLFGAYDIAGKTVTIEGRQFVIAGVYKPSDNKYEKYARGGQSYLFMDYDTFQTLFEGTGITAYEAVLPNPVKGFALTALKTAFGEDEETTLSDSAVSFSDKEYVDNTDRFSNLQLYKKIWNLPKLMMRGNAVAYPYWENAVRSIEMKAAFLLILRTLLLAFPVISLAIWLVITVKREYHKWKAFVKGVIENAIDRQYAKAAAKRAEKEGVDRAQIVIDALSDEKEKPADPVQSENLPENEKSEEPALSEEELMEKIVREAKISWEKRKEQEELMEIRRKEQIEARRKAREAEEEQESKDEI